VVGSTPTRFRHIDLICQKLQKNGAAKGGNQGKTVRFLYLKFVSDTSDNRLAEPKATRAT
jgi:hypothetical protein